MRLREPLLCVAAGILLALGFPPYEAPWWCIPLSVAIWLRGLRDATAGKALLRTLVFALSFHLLLLRWMMEIGTDAWIALSMLEALFLVPVGLVLARVRAAGMFVLLAVVLVPLSDWCRDHAGPVAFGWGQLAFATVDAPWMRLAPHLSQWTLTGLVAGVAALLALTTGGAVGTRLVAGGAAILVLTLPLLPSTPLATTVGTTRIALVQAGATHLGIGFSATPRDVLSRHADLSLRELEGTDAGLIVWPENALDVDPYHDIVARRTLAEVSLRLVRPLLVGAVLTDATGRRNASLLTDGSSLATVYVKRRLVPFGEVMPLRPFMERWFARTSYVPMDFVPGTSPGHVTVAGMSLGLIVCFEVADESVVADALAHGERALILQTNNATYSGLGQSEQQLRIAQVRALMFGVPVAMVSTTGPTAVIDSTGRIVRRLDEGDEGVLLMHLPGATVTS